MSELKACRCGGNADVVITPHQGLKLYSVRCSQCTMSTEKLHAGREEVIKYWNFCMDRRTVPNDALTLDELEQVEQKTILYFVPNTPQAAEEGWYYAVAEELKLESLDYVMDYVYAIAEGAVYRQKPEESD